MICRELEAGAPPCTFREALLTGLGPRGGLLLPEDLPRFEPDELAALFRLEPPDRMARLSGRLLADEFGEREAEEIARQALDFPIPTVALGPGRHVLELFHGPTLAFKDVGARFMARAIAATRRAPGPPEPSRITILTATSGDTGSAVASAFAGVPGVRAVILYPEGRISELQELQMITHPGNVRACAVKGSFDDCQRLVRAAFENDELRREVGLTTANSMNLGRLLPQTFYYFEAAARLHRLGLLRLGAKRDRRGLDLLISVPSGNFGNLTAGLLAWKMGLPVGGFVAATNVNDTVPRFLRTGRLEPRETVRTHSSAMDVSRPGNWPRILSLFAGEVHLLRKMVRGIRVTDEETLETMREVEKVHGYLLDPHGAVGYAALARSGIPATCGLVLATAHPAKFPEVIQQALGRAAPVPEVLERLRTLPVRRTRLEGRSGELEALLRERE